MSTTLHTIRCHRVSELAPQPDHRVLRLVEHEGTLRSIDWATVIDFNKTPDWFKEDLNTCESNSIQKDRAWVLDGVPVPMAADDLWSEPQLEEV